ncbi:MAG: hypothetical protein ACLR4A_00240 [Christensenellales bacterium]
MAALEHDDYFAWAKHANEMADLIRAGMERAGIPFFQRTTTNQIFAVLTEEQNAALELDFAYERWAKLEDGRVAVPLCDQLGDGDGGLREAGLRVGGVGLMAREGRSHVRKRKKAVWLAA